MKTKSLLILAVMVFILAVATGCNRELVLKTSLDPAEKVSKGDTVLVDGVPAGHVKNLVIEGSQRLAVLAIEDEAGARQKMRTGVVRVIRDGQIDLRTEGVTTDSAALPSGSLIPTKSKATFAVGKVANTKTVLVILLVVVGVSLLVVLFRSAKRAVVLLLALLLAVATGWVLHPYAVPWVEKLYKSVPSAAESGDAQTDQTPDQNSTGQSVAGLERRAVEILNHRPDARLVAFTAVSVVGFMLYVLFVGSAMHALKPKAC